MIVTIVTLTSGRNQELIRCVKSVKAQKFDGYIEHIIVNDNSTWLYQNKEKLLQINKNLLILDTNIDQTPTAFQPLYWPSRSGCLRNIAFAASTGKYIVQLDDDNTIDTNHVSSLVSTALSMPHPGIAYSWRRVFFVDGAPFLEPTFPWKLMTGVTKNEKLFRRFIYEQYVKHQIMTPGSNIMRDAISSKTEIPVYTIDNNEMLVPRSIMQAYPYTVWYTLDEMLHCFTEDYKFVRTAYENSVPFYATRQVTLNYFLGGVSYDISSAAPNKAP